VVSRSGLNLKKSIDFVFLEKALIGRLLAKGNVVAFSGYSSGEILITAVPKDNGKTEQARSHYVVRIVTTLCQGTYSHRQLDLDWSKPCNIYIDTSLRCERKERNAAEGRTVTRAIIENDALSTELDSLILDYLRTLF
jgi:hypothetical protein